VIVPAFLVAVGLGAASGAFSTNAILSRWLKMAASSLVVVIALVTADDVTAYVVLVIAALCSSWIGDIALSFDVRKAFLIGLMAFALAHVLYVMSFVSLGSPNVVWFMIGAAVMAVVGLQVARWLRPRLPDPMVVPVMGYIVIIGAMVSFAFGTVGGPGAAWLPEAALLFAASDILVARNQFTSPSPMNRVVGLPIYFAAQVMFAFSVG
jgi:uncharacterized membrane protein YhhN